MGSRIAGRLGASVDELRLFDPIEERRRAVAEATGGIPLASPAEAASAAEAVVVVVADADQANEALLGKQGALAGLPSGGVVVVMSTIGPSAMASLGRRVLEAGFGIVDAPMTGGTALAETGGLLLFASGRRADVEMVRPILERCSRSWHFAGEIPGAGQKLKLVNQLLCSVHMMAAAEALAFARALGLDQHEALEAVRAGAGASFILEHYGERMIDGPYQPPSSAVPILLKDSDLVAKEASSRGLSVPANDAAHDLFRRAVEAGLQNDDITSVIRLYYQEMEEA
jgi:3-hydroxyisobutyrate dehydrogenase-like beta-hydroxyacid dehydrogenase